MIKLSIVSPVYYGEKSSEELVKRITMACTSITKDFEIILVDDGSPDQSWKKIIEISEKNQNVLGIKLSRNFGQHYASDAGLSKAKGDWIVVMDCDLQDRPEEIPRLFSKALEGFDVVVASREQRQDSFLKVFFSDMFYKALSWLTDTEQNSKVANFGIYKNTVIKEINNLSESFRYFPAMIKWVGFKRAELSVQHASRDEGESTYNFRRLLALALEVIIAFSEKPLRMMTYLGLSISLMSFCVGIYVLIRALQGAFLIQGWASIMVSLWLLAGIIMFFLGIVGIYVGRNYREAKGRPIFIISEQAGKS